MKGKSLAMMVAAAAVLGGAGLYFNKSAGPAPGMKVINLAPENVAQIIIKTHTAELHLQRKGDDWFLLERAGYPANSETVARLLLRIWNMKSIQEEKAGPSQYARLELEAPEKDAGTGTRLEFKGKDGQVLGSLIIGKRYLKKAADETNAPGPGGQGGYPAGRYVMAAGNEGRVSLVTETLEEVVPTAETWLDHDFIKPGNITTVALAGTTPERQWKVTRPDAAASTWTLAGAKPDEVLDSGRTTPLATVLNGPGFTDVLSPEAKPADLGLDKPEVLTVETADKITYTLKVGKLMGENYPITAEVAFNPAKERTPGKDEKPEDKAKLEEDFKAAQKAAAEKFEGEKKYQARPYLISKFTIEQVLVDRSSLLEAKKPEGATPAPAPGAPGASGAPVFRGPGPDGVARPPGTKPMSATTPPISVATPPVSVPPSATTPSAPATPPAGTAPAGKPAGTKPAPKPAPAAAKPGAETKPATVPEKPATTPKAAEAPAKP